MKKLALFFLCMTIPMVAMLDPDDLRNKNKDTLKRIIHRKTARNGRLEAENRNLQRENLYMHNQIIILQNEQERSFHERVRKDQMVMVTSTIAGVLVIANVIEKCIIL